MIPVIKGSRLAVAGVALRRHPRPVRDSGEQAGQASAPSTACSPAPVYRRDGAIPDAEVDVDVDADAAARVVAAPPRQDPCAEGYDAGYDSGYATGQRTGWGAGHEEGLRDGVQMGREDAGAAARVQADALEKLGAAVAHACTQHRAAIESGAIEIAYAAVLRLIGERAGDRAVVADIVRRVLEQMPERTLHSIRVSPVDHALLQQGAHGLKLRGALLVADERVGLGGCIIDTDAGSLDGRLETQLSELKTLLVTLHQAHPFHEAQP